MIPRLYVEYSLQLREKCPLSENHVHYLLHVLRRKKGDEVRLFNEKSGEFQGIIDELGKNSGWVQIQSLIRLPAKDEPKIWLFFAPLKKEANDFLIEKGTELGVTTFCPLQMQHGQTHRINRDRWRAQAVEAAEQCHRLSVPEFLDLSPFVEGLKTGPSSLPLIYGDTQPHVAPIQSVLPGLDLKRGVGLLVGPEGGFSSSELTFLRGRPHVHGVSLGPRILRAETAALTLVAAVQLLK